MSITRSTHAEVFCKEGVLRKFAKFTGKRLCQSLFFNKVPGMRPATLLKKILAQVFSCEFCEISKNTFSYRAPTGGCFCITLEKFLLTFEIFKQISITCLRNLKIKQEQICIICANFEQILLTFAKFEQIAITLVGCEQMLVPSAEFDQKTVAFL